MAREQVGLGKGHAGASDRDVARVGIRLGCRCPGCPVQPVASASKRLVGRRRSIGGGDAGGMAHPISFRRLLFSFHGTPLAVAIHVAAAIIVIVIVRIFKRVSDVRSKGIDCHGL